MKKAQRRATAKEATVPKSLMYVSDLMAEARKVLEEDLHMHLTVPKLNSVINKVLSQVTGF